MKTVALLGTILLFSSCSSSNGVIDQATFPCGSGQAIDILAGLEMARLGGRGGDFGGERGKMIVNVANNSDADITVSNVMVDQVADPDATFTFDRAYINTDVTIAEGKEHTFELPMMERTMVDRGANARRSSMTQRALELLVRVKLSNGDSYVCRYSVPSPY